MARLANLLAGLLLLALTAGGAKPAGAERAVDMARLSDAGSPSYGVVRDETGQLPLLQHASASGGGSGGGADGRSSGDSSAQVPPWASRLAGARRDILVWMMRLDPNQCTSVTAWPCFNIYAVNATSGELIWFAYSTDITGIKAASVGHRTLYFTTWSGPGLYAVNLATGRVKWNFPVNNWFAYWRKEIDLPPSASFSAAGEGGAGAGFATALGPPARVYGLRLKGGGELRWEWKAEHQQAVLADVAGPDLDAPPASATKAAAAPGAPLLGDGPAVAAGTRSAAGVLYAALSLPRNGSSQLVALSLADGAPLWSAEPRAGAAFARVEMDGPRLLVADTSAGQLLAYDKADGRLLWHRQKPFCATPHPLSRIHAAARRRRQQRHSRHHRHLAAGGAAGGGEEEQGGNGAGLRRGHRGKGGGSSDSGILLLTEECDSLTTLTAVDTATGKELWSGFDPRHEARVTAGCSAVGVDGGVAYLGCNCQSEGFAGGGGSGGGPKRRRGGGGGSGRDAGEGDEEEGDRMVCLYALELLTGRRLWWREVEVGSGAAFDPEAQAWGQAPLVLGCTDLTVVFAAGSTVLAASAGSGKLLWQSPLSGGGRVAPWQAPAAICDGGGGGRGGGACVAAGDGGGGRLLALIPVVRGAGNLTSYYALDPASGSTVWYRDFNGSAQQPPSRSDGGAAPLALGARVVAETCHRRRCCLRGLNTSTGKVAWRMCLDAVRGTDPTNPRAQFAIWVVTLVTVASIAALILGAALLYINHWAEERALMDAGHAYSGGESGLDYEPIAGARGRGGGGGGTAGGAPRLSLFARAGGAATTVLGGPPSPGSLAAAAFEAEGGAAAAAPWAEDARGRGGGGGGGGLFRGRERVPPRGRGPPRDAAAAAAEGAPPLPAARAGNVAVSWRQDPS